jgi:hypothetical protein
MRRIVALAVSLTTLAVAVLVGTPSAFALRYVPPPSGHGASGVAPVSTSGTPVVTHGGLASWEIAVIVVGATIIAVIVATVLARSLRRPRTAAAR